MKSFRFSKKLFVYLWIIFFMFFWFYIIEDKFNFNIFDKKISNIFDKTPKLIAANFDFNYRKIPFDVWHIDFTLSQDLDPNTITKENFTINPKIDWELSQISPNTIRYKFLENPKVWQDISISLSDKIMSVDWKNLDKNYEYIVSVVNSANVTKITPNQKLDNLSQNLSVFFNIPMVPLTSLENKDSYLCPLEITPKIDWTCKWISSSVFEFTPNNWWQWATNYKIDIVDKWWLLYKIWSQASAEIKTTKLDLSVNKEFSVKDNINLNFNFPVSIESLYTKLNIFEIDKNWNKQKKEYVLYNDNLNESNVVVSLKWDNYIYDKTYKVEISKWLNSKYGNISTSFPKEFETKSFPLLKEFEVFQYVYSWSNVVDVLNFTSLDYIPSENLVLKLKFDEKIDLKFINKFSFQDENWKKYIFDYKYQKLKNEKTWAIRENQDTLYFYFKQKLENWKKFKLVIDKTISQNQKENLFYTFEASPNLLINNLIFIDYSKSCLYTNNLLSADFWKTKDKILKTTPDSKITSINNYDYINYDDQKFFWIYSTSEWNPKNISEKDFLDKSYCPPAKKWEFLYVLSTKLNPNSDYTLEWSPELKDFYWNKLSNAFQKTVKTWDIKNKDRYLYLSLNKNINLIPANLPLVINLQTINISNIDLNVCEMSAESFMKAINIYYQEWFIPDCQKTYSKSLSIKNKNWILTNNKFDLEKDVVWWKLSSPFIFLSSNNSSISFKRFFIRWNLNLTYENASNKNLLFVSDFSWNSVENLNFEFYKYNYENSSLNKINTKFNLSEKSKNIYELPEKNDWKYDFIYAYNDKYVWIVDLNSNMFSDYDFKYYWWESSYTKNYLYLYTERPIYKPGDTVYIKWLLRDFDLYWYHKTPLKSGKLEIIDSNSKSIWELEIEVDENSNFNTKFIIPKDVALWKFSFKFSSWDTFYKNNANFFIEEYKKPDFKIDVEWLKSDYLLWEQTSLEILPTYYFWWKLINTKWKYSVLTQNYFFDAKNYSEYQFWEWYKYFDCIYWWYCDYDDNLSEVKDFNVDTVWRALINHNFSNSTEEWEKINTFNIEIEDKNTNKTVNKSISTILHKTDWYVWLKSSYWNDFKSWINAEFILLDHDAKPVSLKNIKVILKKLEWKEVKKQWIDGYYYKEYDLKETKESEFDISTNSQWIASKLIKTNSSWEYKIEAIYTWQNWKDFVSSINVYVSSDDYVSWFSPNNDTTDLIPEKTQVLLWETAIYTLKSPINNWKALFLIEKDDWILDYFIHDIKSYWDKIEIPVKNNYYPNYYLRVFLIWQETNNPLPVYKRWLTSTKVSTEYKKLNVEVKTNKENYKPWEKVKIEVNVKDNSWKSVPNVNLSVWLVDESLLALVWNPKKNPFAFFYDMKRYLWTLMSSSMFSLVEKLEVKDISWGEKWWAWDQIKGWDSKKKRWIFKDTAFWQANFTSDLNWKAIIETDALPDNLTIWNIEVVANDANSNKIWIWEKTITTNKNVIITDNLPNFFWINDIITLSPIVFNKTWKDTEFIISLDSDNLKINSEKQKKVFIKNWESKAVLFKVDLVLDWLKNENNFSKLTFKAVEVCNSKNCNLDNSDEIEKIIEIKDTLIKESVASIWKTTNNSFDELINLTWIKNKIGKIQINYWATIFSNLLDVIDYLNYYSYSSSEQKTSSVMPNVYIKKLYDSIWRDYDFKSKQIKYFDYLDNNFKSKSIDQTIKEYLVDIRKFQNEDWGFVYRYDVSSQFKNYSDFALSSYILESFSNLAKIWYKQDNTINLNLVKYLKENLYKNQIDWCIKNEKNNCEYSEFDRLNAINSILDYNKDDYEAYKIYKLIDIKNNKLSSILNESILISKLIKINWISKEEKQTLEAKQKENINYILNDELVYNPKWAYIGKTSDSTRLENTSLFLEILLSLENNELQKNSQIIDNINRWMISQKNSWSFWSTKENISVIKAITNYIIKTQELNKLNFYAKINLNWEQIAEKNFNDINKLDVFSTNLDPNIMKDNNTLNLSKTWSWTLYYDLNVTYFIDSKWVQARDEGFSVIKEYYDYNDYKVILEAKDKEWKQYEEWLISYDKLKYKKDIFEYLYKLNSFNLWQLVVVRNKIIVPETRDKVAFEWFVSAWSEIINPNLSSSTKSIIEFWDEIFEKKEYRQDRFFAYTKELPAWIYNFSYLLRFTYTWEFNLKPSYISEIYNPEVFGRSAWEKIIVN